MKIKRQLTTCEFDWDTETKELVIRKFDSQFIKPGTVPGKEEVCLNKVQMFSLMRFIVRISAWGFMRRRSEEKEKSEKQIEDTQEESMGNLQ